MRGGDFIFRYQGFGPLAPEELILMFTSRRVAIFIAFDRLLAELDGLVGAVAGERVEQPFSSVPAQLIDVSGGTVQVYEFETIAEAINLAIGIEQNQQIDWIDSSHFFRRGNVFAIYIGNDAGVLEAHSTATRSLLLQEKQG